MKVDNVRILELLTLDTGQIYKFSIIKNETYSQWTLTLNFLAT